jgi:hypothetical protein
MADRGIRWIRLALYFVGALGLTALAFVFGIGRGKPGGSKNAQFSEAPLADAHLPDAGASLKRDALGTPLPATATTDTPSPSTGASEGKRRNHLRPQVRKPKDPPSWDSFDNSDMNLE